MLKKYLDYLRDNPEGYWFKRQIWGWGWVPVTWQGWAVVGLWLAAVAFFSATLDENSPPREVAFTFVLPILFLTILLIPSHPHLLQEGREAEVAVGLGRQGHKRAIAVDLHFCIGSAHKEHEYYLAQ